MSLILEALKKSEARRRLGEAPDLDTPFAARRRRRSSLPFIAIAIVLAAGAGWWLLRAPRSPEKGTPVAGVQPQPSNPRAQNPSAQNPPARPGADRIMRSAPPVPSSASTAAPAAKPAANERSANSAFVAVPPPRAADGARNFTAPVVTPDKPAVTASVSAMATKTPVAAATVATPAAATPAPGMKKPGIPAVAGVKKPEASAGTAPVAGVKNPELPATTASSAPPYYELPFSVRKDLPAIKLSMHVYAPEPAQRFIILNDSRMTEGDTQNDLALREIRPDGAVFEFHGQRFFFPRDGL